MVKLVSSKISAVIDTAEEDCRTLWGILESKLDPTDLYLLLEAYVDPISFKLIKLFRQEHNKQFKEGL